MSQKENRSYFCAFTEFLENSLVFLDCTETTSVHSYVVRQPVHCANPKYGAHLAEIQSTVDADCMEVFKVT